MVSRVAALIRGLIPSIEGEAKDAMAQPMRSMLRLRPLRWFLRLAPLLVIAPAALLLNDGGAVEAQDGLPPIAEVRDISVRFGTDLTSVPGLYVLVRNLSTIPMRNVQVRLTTDPPEALSGLSIGDLVTDPSYDRAAGILTYSELEVSDPRLNRETETQLYFPSSGYTQSGFRARNVKVRAEVIGSVPAEEATKLHNNQAEVWVNFTNGSRNHVSSNTAISVDVDNRTPSQGENPVFEVTATELVQGSTFFLDLDVVVKVALTDGLAFAAGQSASTSTSFSRTSATTGLWRLGSGDRVTGTLRVPARLTTDAGAAPPLNRRCLSAQIVGSRPPAATTNPDDGKVHTVCLGARPPVVLSDGPSWTIRRWYCDSPRVVYPCREGDEVREDGGILVLQTGEGSEFTFYRSDDVILLVDPNDHVLDPNDHLPLANGSASIDPTWLWSTGQALAVPHGNDYSVPGVKLTRQAGSKQYTKSRKFTISDVSPRERPGTIAIVDRWISSGKVKLYEALNPDKPGKLTDSLPDSWTQIDYPNLVVFSQPGVYKVILGREVTRKSDNEVLSSSGTLTFVVGVLADLQVHDAGLHGTLPRGQRAYTLRAENNLDGTAELVEVALTDVPRGAKAEVSGDGGSYNPGTCDANGLCEGIWKIGDLEGRDERYLSGRSDGPTLTLLVEGNPKPITATISSTKTQTVTAGGQRHTYGVTDLVDANSKDVSVAAGTGRGEPDPEEPRFLRVDRLGATALLRWEAIEEVSRWPVAYYQVERDSRVLDVEVRVVDLEGKDPLYLDLRERGGNAVYRVRAVSDQGILGPWSRPVPDGGLGRRAGAPAVESVRVASAPGVGDSYQPGETIALEVVFSEAVQVEGTPELALEIGDTTRQLPMSAHSDDTLTFSYVVAAGDKDEDGVSVPEDGLTLPSGAFITNFSARVDAVLKFDGLDDGAGHKVNAPGGKPEPPPPPYYVDVPEAPSALSATAGNGYVTLQWAPYCCDERNIFYQYWLGKDSTWRTIPNSHRGTAQHIVQDYTTNGQTNRLINGTTYHFRVRAVYRDEDGDTHPGRPSRMVAATPHAPTTTKNNPPVFAPDDKSYSVVERAPRGTEVARVRATDADSGDRLSYTLSGEHADRFSIDGEGVIRVAEMELGLTWEPGGVSFTLGVEVSDTRGGRDSRSVGVEVTASEQRQAVLRDADPGTLSVACNTAAGTTVATINAASGAGDSLWYILVDGADKFQFAGGGMGPPGTIWSDDHAKLVSDGSGVVLEVGRTLSGEDCGTSIWVVVEIEEDGNPGNNETVSFEVRVGRAGD